MDLGSDPRCVTVLRYTCDTPILLSLWFNAVNIVQSYLGFTVNLDSHVDSRALLVLKKPENVNKPKHCEMTSAQKTMKPQTHDMTSDTNNNTKIAK